MGIKKYIEQKKQNKQNKQQNIIKTISDTQFAIQTSTITELKTYIQQIREGKIHPVVNNLTPGSQEEKAAKGMIEIEIREVERSIAALEKAYNSLERTKQQIEAHKVIDTTFGDFVPTEKE